MKNLFRKLAVLSLSFALVAGNVIPAYAAIPQAYWKYQQPFADAVAGKAQGEILRIGNEVLALFASLPMDNDKAGILYVTSEAMYPIYEKQGQYDKAIECLNNVIECGSLLGYADGVKLAKARIQKIEPMTEVYALSQNTSSLPYFGSKHEPKNGSYYGRVFTLNGQAPMANETAVSFYVEFGQDKIADYDYLIRPQDTGEKIIHIALNMPNENDSLKTVAGSDAYISELCSYLKTLKSPVFLRIGGEMNVWNNLADPALYKSAYIKIANAVRSQAPNTALLFSPNDVSNWNADIGSYYPGDSYVDWVGVSLYTDKFREAQNPVAKEDFEEMFYGNGGYANPIMKLRDIVSRYGNKKPIMITEGGTGHSIDGNGSVDLSGFAKNRIQMLYTYANMVYPQVKGIIYFDHDLKTGKYVYSLSNKPELMAQYTQTTAGNPGILKSMNQKAQGYVKLSNYNDNLPEIALATYCVLPGNIIAKVSYELDGAVLSTGAAIPFPCTIATASLTNGDHSLTVNIKGENGYVSQKNYTLTKAASGQVTAKQK